MATSYIYIDIYIDIYFTLTFRLTFTLTFTLALTLHLHIDGASILLNAIFFSGPLIFSKDIIREL